MAELNVGPGQQYTTIAAAAAASQNGDVISVQAGVYENDFATIYKDVTLQAVDGMVHLLASASPPNGKAILTLAGNITVEGFEFSGARVPDGNGAGIRHEGGNLTVLNSYFHDNENGILTNGEMPEATLTIRDSEFDHNGNGFGNTHGIYVGHIGKLTVDNSFFHDTLEGHQLKSRAAVNEITNSRFYDDQGTGSYSVNLPNGGVATLTGNVLQQGPNGHNPVIVSYGEEGGIYPGSSLTMTDNMIVNDAAGGVGIRNSTTASATATGTDAFGLTEAQMTEGPVTLSGTTYLTMRPTLDESSPWSADPPTEPPVEPPEEPPEEPNDGDLVATDGDDVFTFAPGDGADDGGPFTIRGFEVGEDTIVAPNDTRFEGHTYETWASPGEKDGESGTWVQWSWSDAERVFVAGVVATLEELTGDETPPEEPPEEPPTGEVPEATITLSGGADRLNVSGLADGAVISTGGGLDRVVLGEHGATTFLFRPGDAQDDVIRGFDVEQDMLVFADYDDGASLVQINDRGVYAVRVEGEADERFRLLDAAGAGVTLGTGDYFFG